MPIASLIFACSPSFGFYPIRSIHYTALFILCQYLGEFFNKKVHISPYFALLYNKNKGYYPQLEGFAPLTARLFYCYIYTADDIFCLRQDVVAQQLSYILHPSFFRYLTTSNSKLNAWTCNNLHILQAVIRTTQKAHPEGCACVSVPNDSAVNQVLVLTWTQQVIYF